eukprot:3670965-Prymnesium_polylepis.1
MFGVPRRGCRYVVAPRGGSFLCALPPVRRGGSAPFLVPGIAPCPSLQRRCGGGHTAHVRAEG